MKIYTTLILLLLATGCGSDKTYIVKPETSTCETATDLSLEDFLALGPVTVQVERRGIEKLAVTFVRECSGEARRLNLHRGLNESR